MKVIKVGVDIGIQFSIIAQKIGEKLILLKHLVEEVNMTIRIFIHCEKTHIQLEKYRKIRHLFHLCVDKLILDGRVANLI